jgi:hypothetical protein
MNNTIQISPAKKKPKKYTVYLCVLGVWGLELRKIDSSDCLKTMRRVCKEKIDSEGVYGYTYGICETSQWDKLQCRVVLTSHNKL